MVQSPALEDWHSLAQRVETHSEVLAAAPYIDGFALITHARGVEGVQLQGILPEVGQRVSVVEDHMLLGSSEARAAGGYGIVMGRLLARRLELALSERVGGTLPDCA